MKTLKYWSINIIGDSLLAWMFYLWFADGIEGAKNVVLVIVWASIVLSQMMLLVDYKSIADNFNRPPGATHYQIATHIAWTVAMSWAGWFLTVGFYLIGWIVQETILVSAKRKSAP